jgi:hypothetical protein
MKEYHIMLSLQTLFHVLSKPNAYLDPGSGSFIIQMLIAGIVGAGFLLRGFWSKLFGKRTESDDELDDVDEITEDDETL